MKIFCKGAFAGVLLCAASATATSGTNLWTKTGPPASNVQVEYATADVAYARGGDSLFKSINGGQDWVTLMSRNTSWGPFAVVPGDPDLVFLPSDLFASLLRSTDGGATFTQSSPWRFESLEFNGDGSVGYGAISDVNTRILRTTDKGATWSDRASTGLPVNTPSPSPVPLPYRLAVDNTDSNLVYAGFRHAAYQGVYRSVDGGDSWTPGTGLAGVTVNEIAVHPSVTGRAFAATSAGLFRSDDSGLTWTPVPDPALSGVATLDLQSVAFDRTDALVIHAGGAQRGEIFASTDGGATWSRRGTGVVANRVNSLATRPGHAGELLAGTSHTMYRSIDGGQNFVVSANGILASNIESVQNGSRLRVGLSDGGLYESLDGTSWTPLNNAALRARTGGMFSNIVDILEGDRLFVLLQNGPLLSSTTLGSSWEPVAPGYPLNPSHLGGLLTLNGTGPVHLAGSNYGVYKTFDNGVSWIWSSNGLPPTTIRAFAKNADGSEIYLATHVHGIYKSTDGGATWLAKNNGLASLETQRLAYDADNDVLLVGTNNGLFVSTDRGESHAQLPNPWPEAQQSVHGLVIEDFARGAIYQGFQKRIWRSVDQGQSWTELSEGNPYSSGFIRITSMVSDGPGVLYVGNVESGLMTYTVSPDIRIATTILPAGAYPIGTELPWQITVANDGPYASTFSYVRWQVPQNATLSNVTTTRGSCSLSPSGFLDCDFGVLAPNQGATVSMTLRATSGGPFNVQIDSGSAEMDRNPSNNSTTQDVARFVEAGDLAATLTASTASVNSGVDFDYTLVIRNNGANTVTGATFETRFDPRDQYLLAQGSAAGCSGSVAGTQICPLAPLAPGGAVTYRWTATPQWGGARSATAVATVDAANTIDSNPQDNTATVALDVVPVTDLGAGISSASANVLQGGMFAYTVTITNHSVIDSADITSTITLSDRVQFASATGATCSANGLVIGCAVAPLAAGASRDIVVNVIALTPGSATSTASVASLGPDPLTSNNSANATITIDPANDLSIEIAAPASATTGTSASLTLTARNLTGTEATGALTQLTLSSLLTYASATGATCTSAAAVVTCDLGTIAANGTMEVVVTVNVVTVGTASNSVSISGTALDPNSANDSASASIAIAAPPPPPPPPAGGGGNAGGGGGGGGAFDHLSVILLGGLLGLAMRAKRRRAGSAGH